MTINEEGLHQLNVDTETVEILNYYYNLYNKIDFIENDPIYVPHQFSHEMDIEISGLFASTLAWGSRASIIKNSLRLMQLMDWAPYHFITSHVKTDLAAFRSFVHRTFNSEDVINFIKALRHIYQTEKSIGHLFEKYIKTHPGDVAGAIAHFRYQMIKGFKSDRSSKHIANPLNNSSAKRMCMYMRWMVRKDKSKVDFGLWPIKPSLLYCPLDLHSARTARILGLLSRNQNDWKAVEQLTNKLRQIDRTDPAKYDFALFGMSVNKAV